jgi:hypothetical protein
VLSACNTGLGKNVKGEGVIGLARGFMYAGTARVLASLWKVDDEATAELMTHFYQHLLQEHQTPAAALRAAQIDMWRQKRWHAPYYWAAFVLQGRYEGQIDLGQPTRTSAPRPSVIFVIILAAALHLTLCAFYLRRRARRGAVA